MLLLLLFLLACAEASFYDWRKGASLLQEEEAIQGPPVVALVRSLLAGANTAVMVQDGSPIAQSLTRDLASPLIRDPASQPPLLHGDMTHLLADSHYLTTFPGRLLNTHFGLTVLLFSNVTLATRFLAAKPPGLATTSLLLISLSLHYDARELLVEAQEVRWSALLQARLTPSNRFRHSIINFQPFNPPGSQFHYKVYEGRPLTRGQVFLERYSHFHGRQLQVASWLDDFPFLFKDTSGQVQGLAKVMLDEVASRLHFTYHLQEKPPDGYWGELVNGTWMGMAGQVVRREKDLIIDGFAILLDRYHALDLSVPYFTDSYSAALKVPPPAPRWVAVVYPFQSVVWAGVAVALVLLTITLHAVMHSQPGALSTPEGGRVSWTLLWVAGWLVRQSSAWLPKSRSRPLLASWWLAVIVLSTSYTGSITAFLTVPTQAPRIATLQRLAQADSKLFLLDYGAFLSGYLNTSVDPVYRTLGEKLHLLDSYEGIRAQMEAGHAFVEGTHYTQAKLIGWRMADAYVVDEKMFPNYNGWAFHKGTPWTPAFNKYLLRMREAGLVDHWYGVTLSAFRREHGLAPSQAEGLLLLLLRPLSLSDSQGVFILLGLGAALAIVSFTLEFLCCGQRVLKSGDHS